MTDDRPDDSEGGLLLQKVEYYRLVRKPTLKQFLVREVFAEAAEKTKGQEGVSPDGNRIIPKSAKSMSEELKGLNAEKIAERRPDLVEKYREKYGRGVAP